MPRRPTATPAERAAARALVLSGALERRILDALAGALAQPMLNQALDAALDALRIEQATSTARRQKLEREAPADHRTAGVPSHRHRRGLSHGTAA
jgi:hypothetical protein